MLWTLLISQTVGVVVDEAVRQRLATSGEVDAMLRLGIPLDLESLDVAGTRASRREAVYQHLVRQASESQKGVRATLERVGATFTPFWIVNAIAVRKLSAPVLQSLVEVHANELSSVELIGGRWRHKPVETIFSAVWPPASPHWNIDLISAAKAWPEANGSGIVVATLDGGVSFTHEALVESYRGNVGGGKFVHDFNWRDWAYKRSSPEDDDGHGTNVQGIATAAHGYGVAPGAQWFTGKIFNFAGYSADDWTLAGCQFAMCPTCGSWNRAKGLRNLTIAPCASFTHRVSGLTPSGRPVDADLPENCSLGADVISNSWGETNATSDFLKPVVAAWLKAGIVPVFAVGNAGPECATSVSPSDYDGVLAVGATDKHDEICVFSSRGPAANGTTGPIPYSSLAPSIVAPGLSIAGPSYTDDRSYTDFSGTSQAAPHVAGAAAILLSANPHLSPSEVASLLYNHANTSTLQEPDQGKEKCGGEEWSSFPNYIYGYGRLDVYAALKGLHAM